MNRWDTANNTFSVRVTEYEEKNPVFLHHFNYVFEASPLGTNSWREVFDTWIDDDIPIPHDVVHFLNDNTGYLTMSDRFAVTTDGAHTWSNWDARKQTNDHLFIKSVQVTSDGNGQMTLIPDSGSPTTTLYTKNFGVSWSSQ